MWRSRSVDSTVEEQKGGRMTTVAETQLRHSFKILDRQQNQKAVIKELSIGKAC